MRETTPKVHLVARPDIDWQALAEYVNDVGGERWLDRVEVYDEPYRGYDAELLVEAMGRLCYRSWDVGLNPNVTKVREDTGEYLANLIKSGHGAVLEHAQWSFIFEDVSRVFTHELVRHRVGVAISQESLRYVRLDDLGMRLPAILFDRLSERDAHKLHDAITELVSQMEWLQRYIASLHHLDDDDVSFSTKKQVTSAMRRFAPLGLSTTIGWSANTRTLHHLIGKPAEAFGLRTDPAAEEEMILVFNEVRRIMRQEAPLLFGEPSEGEPK